MFMLRASRRMDILVIGLIIVTVLFFCFAPAVFPGFPRPVLTDTDFSYTQSSGGILHVLMTSNVTNEGTQGNVVITMKLVNTSSRSEKGTATVTFYMQEDETRRVSMTVIGRVNEPYDVVVEGKRK
jgi:hypothetical protein